MTYVKQNWANGVAGGTPINATRLSHMEDGIEGAIGNTGVQNAAPSKLRFKSAPWSDPSHPDWGADPLGITEASASLNTMFAAVGSAHGRVVFPAGSNFRVTKNLYIPGTIDLQFEPGASITLDGDLNAAGVDGDKFFINMGITSKGAAATPWTGRWTGGTVYATTNAIVQRMIQVHAGVDYWFDALLIDVRGAGDKSVSGISGYNDATWCTNPARSRAHFDRIHILASQGIQGGEGIGHGQCDYIWVRDCLADGVGDDALGLHSCSHITVDGFKGRATHGRIYLSNCTDFSVEDYYIERIANPADGMFEGGGGLFFLDMEDNSQPICSRGRIVSGELVLPNGVPSATYMARFRGARDIDVDGMQFRCGTTNTSAGLTLESVTTVGWSDPEGLDAGTKARVRNCSFRGLHTTGTVDVGVAALGSSDDYAPPVTIDNSVVGPPLLAVSGVVWTPVNRVRSGLAADLQKLHGDCVPNAVLLFEAPVTMTAGVTTKAARATGLTRFYPRKPGVVLAVSWEFASDVTAGDIFVGVRKNGGAEVEAMYNGAAGTNVRGSRSTMYDNAGYAFSSSDYLEVQITPYDLLPTPLQGWIRVFGLYA